MKIINSIYGTDMEFLEGFVIAGIGAGLSF